MPEPMAGAVQSPVVLARGLTKRFGKTTALGPVDLEIPAGIAVALVGRTGAGKTTAIRLLSGLANPSGGSVSILDAAVGGRGWLEARRRLGVMVQEPTFHGWMTGRELLELTSQLAGIPRRERPALVTATLERLGLAGAAGRRIETYPAGMRLRLGVGQAVVGRPALVLLDEPLGSLAADEREIVKQALRELREVATVLFTAHEFAELEDLADRVVVLEAGRVLVDAPAADLLDRLAPPAYTMHFATGEAAALERLATRLRLEPWVARADPEGDTVAVAVSDDRRASRDLLALVVAAGLRPIRFDRRRPTLEDLLPRLLAAGAGEDAA